MVVFLNEDYLIEEYLREGCLRDKRYSLHGMVHILPLNVFQGEK